MSHRSYHHIKTPPKNQRSNSNISTTRDAGQSTNQHSDQPTRINPHVVKKTKNCIHFGSKI